LLLLNGLEEASSESLVDEEATQIDEPPSFGALEKRKNGIREYGGQLIADHRGETLEDCHQVRRKQCAFEF
jgi:hypothetical protein